MAFVPLSTPEREVADSRWQEWRETLTKEGSVPLLVIGTRTPGLLDNHNLTFCCPSDLSGHLVGVLRAVADALERGVPLRGPRIITPPDRG